MSSRKKTARRRKAAKALNWRLAPEKTREAVALVRRRIRQADDALQALEILAGEQALLLAGIAQTAPRVSTRDEGGSRS